MIINDDGKMKEEKENRKPLGLGRLVRHAWDIQLTYYIPVPFRNLLGHFRKKVTSDGMWAMLGVGTLWPLAPTEGYISVQPYTGGYFPK